MMSFILLIIRPVIYDYIIPFRFKRKEKAKRGYNQANLFLPSGPTLYKNIDNKHFALVRLFVAKFGLILMICMLTNKETTSKY